MMDVSLSLELAPEWQLLGKEGPGYRQLLFRNKVFQRTRYHCSIKTCSYTNIFLDTSGSVSSSCFFLPLLLPAPFLDLFAGPMSWPELKATLQYKRASRPSQVPMKAQPNMMLLKKMLKNIKPEWFKIFDKAFTGMQDHVCLYISLKQNKDHLIYHKSQVNVLKTK